MSPYRILTVTGLLAGLTLPVLTQPAAATPPPGPAYPVPSHSVSAHSVPGHPVPTRPGPTRPGPTQPGPTQPGPAQPGPHHGPHAAAAVSAQDAAFLRAAHQDDIAEIGAGGIATSKGSGATVRELGALLIRDHKAMDTQLTTTASGLGVTLPDTPSRAQLELTKKYLATDGAAFDRLYLRTQLAGHRAALAGIRVELTRGSNPEVKKLAAGAAPVVRKHISALRAAIAH
jgi:putative membrane protein